MTALFGTIAWVFFVLTILRVGIGDLITMRIPNWLILALLTGYAVLAPLSGLSMLQIALSLAAAFAVFCLAIGAYARGWMGGGDVKLLAVASLWLGLPHLPAFLLWTSLFGGVLTLALLLYRSMPIPEAVLGRIGWAMCLNANETRVPYGVAISSAALLVFLSTPWMATLH
jgi:prepilin peptidase CpaA